MSQTSTVTESVVLSRATKAFPQSWLKPHDAFVIERSQWNHEAARKTDSDKIQYSIEWPKLRGNLLTQKLGVELVHLIVRYYFGIDGCIIPIGCVTDFETKILAFTIAGPTDSEGRKEFYVLHHYGFEPESNTLRRFIPGFASVAEFHHDASSKVPEDVDSVEGGKVAYEVEWEKKRGKNVRRRAE